MDKNKKGGYLFFGLALVWTAIWWFLAWTHGFWPSQYSFFPLWLGYIFTVNALSEFLFGDSLLRRMRWSFIWLFIISIPLWWFFEGLNMVVQNWQYLIQPISPTQYFIESSVDFSTVIPAVLSVSFLLLRFLRVEDGVETNPAKISDKKMLISVLLGGIFFALVYSFPHEAFPLIWVAPLLVIDPLNCLSGLPSVLGYWFSGRRRFLKAVMFATLLTGFFWEMWNFYSYPKWFYIVPYVGFAKIFEMPILGYLGYLPFGLIVWSWTTFFAGWLNKFLSLKITLPR